MDKRIIAHRGASAYAPENTMEAFALAAEMGAGAIELDVYMTKDGRLAVHHDGNISRMTNGACGEFVENMTLADLKSYKFSGRFTEQYPDATLPELCEVYALMKEKGMVVNTELKTTTEDVERRKKYLELLFEAAAKTGMEDSIIYSAFGVSNLVTMYEMNKDAYTALLYSNDPQDKPDWTAWDFCKSIGCRAVHPHFKRVLDLGKSYVDNCHALGIKVHPWTVDAPADVKALLDLGADAVITNFPDVLEK